MSYGYSIKVVEANQGADGENLGVQLGRVCIMHNVPVSKVAAALGITRQTTYNWFCGVTSPKDEFAPLIRNYISQLHG